MRNIDDFELFINETLDRYDPGMGNIDAPRSMTDLSPLELWLLKELYFDSKLAENLIKQLDES